MKKKIDKNVIHLSEALNSMRQSAKGGFKKISGFRKINDGQCMHPEHKPPMHIVLSPGVWEYTCPCCGESVVVHSRHVSI